MRTISMTQRTWTARTKTSRADPGQTMVILVISLAVAGVLGTILLGTVFSSNGSGQGVSGEPGVAEASGLQAQQTLSQALSAAENAASGGGYSSLSPQTLSASDPSISFVDGPSSNASTISISVDAAGGAGTGGASSSGAAGVGGIEGAIAAAGAGGAADAGGGGGVDSGSGDGAGNQNAGGGSVTLANRSTAGTCWLVWKSGGSATWYGAQTDQPSCTAPALASPPSPGPVSSSSIGWQENSFPGG
jgi:hypothetical protein